MSSDITVTDLFCGAGGSSLGAMLAGATLRLALNHWAIAIQTHIANCPLADHDCTDISACDPRRYYSTDMLIASPECTNHSVAKGRKRVAQPDLFGQFKPNPEEERSRATMWDVPRFAEVHGYRVVIVENVVDARKWVMWDAWLHAMHLLGYEHKCVYLNSMFAHPTPQSRDRMYVVFWKKGNKKPNLEFNFPAWCPRCEKDCVAGQAWKNGRTFGKYGSQYEYVCTTCGKPVTPYYYCAANVIDWSIPIERIGDRKKMPKESTLRRIEAGLRKFGAQPMNIDLAFAGAGGRFNSMDEPLPTQTTRQTGALVVPFLIEFRNNQDAASLSDPLSTVCTSGSHHGLCVPPFVASYYGSQNISDLSEPLPTITTVDRHSLVVPPFIMGNYTPGTHRPLTDAIGTVTTSDHNSLVVPPFIVSYYTRVSGTQAAISRLSDPLPTQPTWPVHYLSVPDDELKVEDCGFRMLHANEIKKAMAFPDDYKVTGNGRQQVKQYGNAVTPPAMKLIAERCIQTFM